MIAIVIVAAAVVLLWAALGGMAAGSPPREDRRITGAEYDPTSHQVLRENVFKDP